MKIFARQLYLDDMLGSIFIFMRKFSILSDMILIKAHWENFIRELVELLERFHFLFPRISVHDAMQ